MVRRLPLRQLVAGVGATQKNKHAKYLLYKVFVKYVKTPLPEVGLGYQYKWLSLSFLFFFLFFVWRGGGLFCCCLLNKHSNIILKLFSILTCLICIRS